MRIFIGLTEVSGYYAGLKKGFDELGIESYFVSLQEHPFKYHYPEKLHAIYKFARFCVTKRVKKINADSKQKWFWTGLVLISRILLFIWALFKFDVFLLGGGSTFFRFAEFPILKLFGRKIIYTFHGTDARPAYIDGFCEGTVDMSKKGDLPVDTYVRVAKKRQNDVKRVERYADVIVNAPPQGQFFTKPFVIGLVIGLPVQNNLKIDSVSAQSGNGTVRILHSPSQLEGKGTKEIRKAIKNLINKGYEIDYIEISGKPNFEILAEVARCDFVVDQLYSDSPMAGFACEAAFSGKPAVVGGYYSQFIKKDLETEWIPPSLYCLPETIEQAIEKLVMDKKFRIELGQRAQNFVRKNFSAKNVASKYLQLINDDYPKSWLYEPRRIRYLHGMGLPENKTKKIIKAIIEKYGPQALSLNDKPGLEEAFVKFANGDKS